MEFLTDVIGVLLDLELPATVTLIVLILLYKDRRDGKRFDDFQEDAQKSRSEIKPMPADLQDKIFSLIQKTDGHDELRY